MYLVKEIEKLILDVKVGEDMKIKMWEEDVGKMEMEVWNVSNKKWEISFSGWRHEIVFCFECGGGMIALKLVKVSGEMFFRLENE